MMEEIKAYGKINLSLDVCGRLENGYHLVKMVMQTVDIYDVLTFEKTEGEVVLTTNAGELPLNEENIIYKAYLAMKERFALKEGLRVHLEKHIPIAAGMAGGSTDAAAALKAINRLFELGLSMQQLMEIGVTIGADVPYCIMGGTALAEGIGEVLTPLPAPVEEGKVLLVAKPDINVSTKMVYELLDSKEIQEHPDVDGMVNALRERDHMGMVSRMGNCLEQVTIELYPIIRDIKGLMMQYGADNAMMSGSGPTVFGIFSNKERAQEAYEALADRGLAKQLFVTTYYNGGNHAG